MAGEAQRVINVIRQAIEQETGDQVKYLPGIIQEQQDAVTRYRGVGLLFAQPYSTASFPVTSAYIRSDELVEDIIVPSGVRVQTGDYAVIALSESGKAWVDRVLPTSKFDVMVADYNRGLLGFGGGETSSYHFGNEGDILVSQGGTATAVWQPPPDVPYGYTEGTFTPTVTFLNAGDLAVTYSENSGSYVKIGNRVDIAIHIVTSSFTHSTASGVFHITGLPFNCLDGYNQPLNTYASGWVKSGAQASFVTQERLNNLLSVSTQSGSAPAYMGPGEWLSGGTLDIRVSGSYIIQ